MFNYNTALITLTLLVLCVITFALPSESHYVGSCTVGPCWPPDVDIDTGPNGCVTVYVCTVTVECSGTSCHSHS